MDKQTNLIGRQVYFKMDNNRLRLFTNISFLTPNKLYTIVGVKDKMAVFIIDDDDDKLLILLKPYICAHLNRARWILKRETKPETKSNG